MAPPSFMGATGVFTFYSFFMKEAQRSYSRQVASQSKGSEAQHEKAHLPQFPSSH